jgi:hypothetical protein
MKKQYKTIITTAIFTLLLSSFSFAQSDDIVPIMIMDNLPHTAILGGVKDNKFISAGATAEALKTKQNYFMVDQEGIRKFDFDGEIKTAQSAACSDYFETEVTAEVDYKGLGFGANADWNPAPHKVAELFNFGVYKPIVAKFLRGQGIRNPKVKISQIFYGDLDGDGRNEDVISATNADAWEQGGAIQRGDYSFVMVRKLVGGRVKTILLEGVFFPRGLTQNLSPGFYDISAIADLNGDGNMEIVVGGFEYENTFYKAFEIDGAEKRRILQIECGI